MRQVSKEQFFARIYAEKLDVHPHIEPGPYPYTSVYTFHRQPGRPVYGKAVGRIEGGLAVKDYYLAVDQ